uniref:non-specific serine/threonine protein kinase n=1 Tax=Chenopodium quinoa TaxID=63459 RepID=A0A803LBV6_CHEQI
MQQLTTVYTLDSTNYGGNETDYTALLAIKSKLIDHSVDGVLSSWNHSHHHCFWDGVTCEHRHNTVISLSLTGNFLGGTISPFIGNLSNLKMIAFGNTGLHGHIPPEVGRLLKLQSLDLSNNQLQGELPMGLGASSNLKYLWVYSNKLSGSLFQVIQNLTRLVVFQGQDNGFTGTIPTSILRVSNLICLNISSNQVSGIIPPSISNLSSLELLDLSKNQLHGEFPVELGALSNLIRLLVSSNKISSMIPSSISNLSSLEYLDLSKNQLHGKLPMELGALPRLIFLNVFCNSFTGLIPPSIFNLSSLEVIYLAFNQLHGRLPLTASLPHLKSLLLFNNHLSGPLPMYLSNLTRLENIEFGRNNLKGNMSNFDFGHLHSLKKLILHANSFEGDISFITTLVSCRKLYHLSLGHNYFTGLLPRLVVNLFTTLTWLDISQNLISGEFPKDISNLINLRIIYMDSIGLTRTIPQDLGKLQKLEQLYLNNNKLTGEIPISIANLPYLSILSLSYNNLEGSIPPSLGNCKNLLSLYLSNNNFNGPLPKNLFAGSAKFVKLHLSYNKLEGPMPVEISKQVSIVELGLSGNKLIGLIPDVFNYLPELVILYMGDNMFSGSIPPTFTFLKSLSVVDLSKNNLSGTIPQCFSTFPIMYLNLSYNDFEGSVPTKGVFANASAISLDGNSRLCGGIWELHLTRCVEKNGKKRRMSHALKLTFMITSACVGVLVMATCIWLYLKRRSKKGKSSSLGALQKESFLKVSYDMLLKATDGFSSTNLLGSGTFGSVFKGMLDGKAVAIKVLNLQQRGGSKSFMTECEALRNIRHRNLVGILTACSSMDFQRNDFKALVYELMPNGSVERWLHENGNLSLLQRLDIAIDVAHAINYLHCECGSQIVHCDLKPSNILLDNDMVARVADFGLAKVLHPPVHPNQSSSIGIKGTVGYVAPEYGLGNEASFEADLYSYGILLLELMTRKRPIDHMFNEDFNLHMYAKAALPDQVLQIVDSTLLEDKSDELDETRPRTQVMLQKREECMVFVINIGVACSSQLPNDRMKIREVISELQHARNILCKPKCRRNLQRGTLI